MSQILKSLGLESTDMFVPVDVTVYVNILVLVIISISMSLHLYRSTCTPSMLFKEMDMAALLCQYRVSLPSVHMLTLASCIKKSRSLMKLKHKSGPKEDPCGAPQVIPLKSEEAT